MIATTTDYTALLGSVQTEALAAVAAGVAVGIAVFAVKYGPRVAKSLFKSLAGG